MSYADDRELRALEERRYAALESGNYDVFESICHPDLRYVHSSGTVDSRAAYLRKLRAGYYRYSELAHTVDRLDVLDDVAMVFGSVTCTVAVNGTGKLLNNLCLSVWVRTDGRWLLYAYQPTALAKHARE